MNQAPNSNDKDDKNTAEVTWGPKLFFTTLLVILSFFYWLLIYSGGVTPHHG